MLDLRVRARGFMAAEPGPAPVSLAAAAAALAGPLPRWLSFGACRDVEELEKIERIGEGTYGIVYAVRDTRTRERYALKRMRVDPDGDGVSITALREISILRQLDHPNVVQLRDVFVGVNNSVFLAFEYLDHDMASLLDSGSQFTEPQTKTLLVQLLAGVAFLHARGILHRDIKAANLLYSNTHGRLVLADFGLARESGLPIKAYTGGVVTLWYRAPELLLGAAKYGTEVDVWAVGAVFGEWLLGVPMLPGKTEPEQLAMVAQLLGAPSETIWPGLGALPGADAVARLGAAYRYNRLKERFPMLSAAGVDLIKGLLTYNPAARLSARDATAHPYFAETPFPTAPALMPSWPSLHSRTHAHALGVIKRPRSPSPNGGRNVGVKRR